MKGEVESLKRNKTADLVKPPPKRNMITGKWCLPNKRDATGCMSRHKPRYVARYSCISIGPNAWRRPHQLYQTHIFESDDGSCGARWTLRQIDVDTVLLYVELEEELYYQQPEIFEELGEQGRPLVYRLKKATYGLKQAGRTWWQKFNQYLEISGYTSASCDPCVYCITSKKGTIILEIFVDDLVLAGSIIGLLDEKKITLRKKYSIKPSEKLSHVLGIRIDHNVKTGRSSFSKRHTKRASSTAITWKITIL